MADVGRAARCGHSGPHLNSSNPVDRSGDVSAFPGDHARE
jgi:hypothetical protein